MKIPSTVATQIQQEIDRLKPGGGFHVNDEGIRANALPLMGTIGTTWLLRADGTFWEVDTEFAKPLTPLPKELEFQALAYGAEKFPWLAVLFPSRPPDLSACELCKGARLIIPNDQNVSLACPNCNGVGWVEKRPR